jgi:hypothetical protein
VWQLSKQLNLGMGAGICKPAKYDENGVPKPPEPASGELILHDNTLLPAPIAPTPKSPAPTSPSSTNATTNNTALNTTAKNATHATSDTTLPEDPGTTTATQSTTATTAATTTAAAPPTPSKWDDWDEEEENPEQPSPQKDGSITSDATTHSSSSTVPTSTVPATATTTITETAEDTGGGSTSQVGISVGSDEAALHGPLGPAVSPTLLCTKCDHDVFCSTLIATVLSRLFTAHQYLTSLSSIFSCFYF